MSSSFSIRTTVRGPVPRLPFDRIARAILGSRYDLSLVLCGDTLARHINKKYRLPRLMLLRAEKKNYAPNVLSFPLARYEGEIVLNVRAAKREAKKYGVPARARLALLFVHGCMHLKGLSHGRTMEAQERRILRAFGYQWHGESTQASTSARTTSRS